MARAHDTHGEALLGRAGRLIGYKMVDRRCPVCRKRMSFTGCKRDGVSYDHIIPCAIGGENDQLLPLCGQCNSSKGAELLENWLPTYLVRIGLAKSMRSSKPMTRKLIPQLHAVSDALKSALIEAGIWS